MTLHFSSLGSGSKGNATLVKSANSLLMIDCGFTIKETIRRLAVLGHQPDDITAILVTHEHSDHIKGVGPFARKFNLPVYLTHGSKQYDGVSKLSSANIINCHKAFEIDDIEIMPVAVPHDAREPCQFVFKSANKTLGILTDVGNITPFVIDRYKQCDALMLECNHDPKMLSMGPYPPSLKLRVGGQWGHLSNHQAANLLRNIEHQRIQHLVISHISEKNNTEKLAKEAICEVYGNNRSIILADQEEGVNWLEVC